MYTVSNSALESNDPRMQFLEKARSLAPSLFSEDDNSEISIYEVTPSPQWKTLFRERERQGKGYDASIAQAASRAKNEEVRHPRLVFVRKQRQADTNVEHLHAFFCTCLQRISMELPCRHELIFNYVLGQDKLTMVNMSIPFHPDSCHDGLSNSISSKAWDWVPMVAIKPTQCGRRHEICRRVSGANH